MEEEIFLPTLSHWQHMNPWTGSWRNARFTIEVEEEGLKAQLWRGPLIRALSSAARERRFDVTQEGLSALRTWIFEEAVRLESDGATEEKPSAREGGGVRREHGI